MTRRSIVVTAAGMVLAHRPSAAPASRRVRVLATTEAGAVRALIADFERAHPGQQVDYRQVGSVEIAEQFLGDGGAQVDVVWSSAMDLQIKLVNDGHAQRYESPHAPALPRWAVWKHEAYGTTAEPIGLALHRGLLGRTEAPATREALAALLQSDVRHLRDRVATYDIGRAGLGFLLAAFDAAASPDYWALVRALGRCRASLSPDTTGMLEGMVSGRTLLAYNVLGSYAEATARRHPEVVVTYLRDYTLLASRIAFISRRAPNPDGARAWLDHLLSPRGQGLLEDAGFYPVRTDVAGGRTGHALRERLGDAAQPIAIGPGLLAHLDRSSHGLMSRRWRREFESEA